MDSRIKNAWTRLTCPAESIESDKERHQAKLLISMLVVVLIVGIIIVPLWLLVTPDYPLVPAISVGIVIFEGSRISSAADVIFKVGCYILIGLVLTIVAVTLLTAPGPMI